MVLPPNLANLPQGNGNLVGLPQVNKLILPPSTSKIVKGKYIVEIKEGTKINFINTLTPSSVFPKYKYENFPKYIAYELDDQTLQFVSSNPDVVKIYPVDQMALFQPDLKPMNLGLVSAEIHTPEAHTQYTQGENTVICIVDTGICGTIIPTSRKFGGWSFDSDAWSDYYGHGSMCAAIACADTADGNKYMGIAPKSLVYSGKTHLTTDEIIAIYNDIMTKAQENPQYRFVVSNSWGFDTCEATGYCNHPLVSTITTLINNDIVVVFAAGNEHTDCGGSPENCTPNTIWAQSSLRRVISVGTVDSNGDLWSYSSRGGGECVSASDAWAKPDVVAPTYGEINWGCSYQTMSNGWGTSGACPQVAGIASLILSLNPNLSVDGVHQIIVRCASNYPNRDLCMGYGKIDALKACQITSGDIPQPTCTVDTDCETGYSCIDGSCIPTAPPGGGGSNLVLFSIAGFALGFIVLKAIKKKKYKRKA